ncbi:rhamnogalacturonan acetylesterase [Paenibacillus bovis]|uniref:rhamnogalacturonan acetylesterase n=1 Tax=Paenibacillus bovis TaxID=1616788 RepID=UPI001D130EF0|nr:rhamnogalacturonan acetylesterase [Paenibacillus bovis]
MQLRNKATIQRRMPFMLLSIITCLGTLFGYGGASAAPSTTIVQDATHGVTNNFTTPAVTQDVYTHLPTIYLAGDSTVQTYREAQRPQAGWGQMIGQYLDDSIAVSNQAIGGRSSRSFIEQGRLDTIISQIQPGDYLMIQFGHNDADRKPERYTPVQDYHNYLKVYIHGARSKGATPILVTPVSRRDYNASGQFNVSFPEYVAAMKQVAAETQTPLLDLSARSVAYYNSVGIEGTTSIFLHVQPGLYPYFPNGVVDNTHFQEYGAMQIAGLVAEGIRDLGLPLSEHVLNPASSAVQ